MPDSAFVPPLRKSIPRRAPAIWLREAALGADYFAYMGVRETYADSPAEVVSYEAVFFDTATRIALDARGELIRSNLPTVPDTPRLLGQIAAIQGRVETGAVVELADTGPLVLLPTPRHDNYFHFLFDDLGRLGFYQALDPFAATRFPVPTPRPWQRQLYALAHIESRLLPLPAGVIVLRDVWIAPRGLARIEEFRSQALFRVRALADGVPDATSPGPRRIYVSRAGTSHRRLINEAEVRRRAEARGFARVLPESMPIADQIRLFRGADAVLGVFGAGLTNAAFMRPGTTLLEMAPSRLETPPVVHNAIFSSLAGAVGLRYGLISAPSAALDEASHDFAVPIDWLDTLLDRTIDEAVNPAEPFPAIGWERSDEGEDELGASP